MTRIRRGGYIFYAWIGDHPPRHVHVVRDGVLVLKWNLDEDMSLCGIAKPAIVAIIRELQEEGRL